MIDQSHLWRTLSSRLGFEVVAPARLELGDETVEFTAWLPQFGGFRGLIAEAKVRYLSNYWDAPTEQGHGYSAVQLGSDGDDGSACEMLRDWTWTSNDPPPPWY